MRYAALAVKRLVAAGCVLPATRRSPREGSGCQGGDPWLRHGEGACARALTQERAQRTLRRLPAGRTAAARCRPGQRPPSLPAPDASPAMGSLPLRPAPRSTEPDKRPMPASWEERTPPGLDAPEQRTTRPPEASMCARPAPERSSGIHRDAALLLQDFCRSDTVG